MVASEFVFAGGDHPRSWLAYMLMSALKLDTEAAACVAAGLFAEHIFVGALGASGG